MSADPSLSGEGARRGHDYRGMYLREHARGLFGDVNNEWKFGEHASPQIVDKINQYPAPEETPPEPFNSVPFPRDPDFVDCGALENVKQRLLSGSNAMALVGLGGVGKSQIAIECTYRLREQSPETWVLWIHASNAARFEACVRDTADKLKLPSRKRPTVNIFQLLHNWLFDKKNGTWVVVLDNVDDLTFLSECQTVVSGPHGKKLAKTAGPMLSRVFPVCDHGSVLITSRDKSIAQKLVEVRDIITVQPMEPRYAEALLIAKLRAKPPVDEKDRKDISTLAENLEFLPPAMTQAAAYIKRREPRSSVSQYLTKLQRSESKLLERENEDLRRDSEVTNSIFSTWQISFNHIRKTQPSAAGLLELMSLFDRQAIPAHLFKRERKEQPLHIPGAFPTAASDTESDDQSSDSDDGLGDDFTLLREYCFISVTADGTAFDMHRLVQAAMRQSLRRSGQLERAKEAFIQLLYSSYPSCDYKNWPECQKLFPHVMAALEHRPKSNESLQWWAALLDEAAGYAQSRSWGNEAVRLSSTAAPAYEVVFGVQDIRTLYAQSTHAAALRVQWRLAEAEELMKSIVNAFENTHGMRHHDTLRCKYHLALLLLDQAKLEQAEKLFKHLMEVGTVVFGPGSEALLRMTGGLASTYREQERWAAAEELELEVFEGMKKMYGWDHPSTLLRMNELMVMYSKQTDRLEESIALGEDLLNRGTSVFGPDNVATLTIMENLVETLLKLEKWGRVAEILPQVIKVIKKSQGPEHPEAYDRMLDLVEAYYRSGQPEKSDPVLTEVILGCMKCMGVKDGTTLEYVELRALDLYDANRAHLALSLMEKCAILSDRVLGADHPSSVLRQIYARIWQLERQRVHELARELAIRQPR